MVKQSHKILSETTDILEVIRLLYASKWVLAIFTTFAAISSVAYSISKPNIFEAQTVLVSTDQSHGGALNKLASQFGEIGGLAGSVFSDDSVGRSVIALEILRSWNFAESFLRKYELEADIWASVNWDEKSNRIIYDKSIYDPALKEWKIYNGESVRPTSWKLFRKYKESLSVSHDDDTGLIKVGFEHHSPNLSKRIVELLVIEINSLLQEADAKSARENIEFLEQRMRGTPNSEMQQAIARLIEGQMKTLMLSSGPRDYALRVVTAAKAPQEKKRPKRALICVFGTIAGFMFGVLFVLGRNFWPHRTGVI